MFFNILLICIVSFVIIFTLGFIGQIIYLIVTPSEKLTTTDCLRKNILFKFLKIK